MDQKSSDKGGVSPQPDGASQRKERLAAALRDNLKKRKAQGRARAVAPANDSNGPASAPQKPDRMS